MAVQAALFSLALSQAPRESATAQQVIRSLFYAVGADVVFIAAGILAILLVGQIERRQGEKLRRVKLYLAASPAAG